MFEEYKITACKPLPYYRLYLTFADGQKGTVDLSHVVGKGMFSLWEDYREFEKVHIDPENQTVCWNEDIDLCPMTLREDPIPDPNFPVLPIK